MTTKPQRPTDTTPATPHHTHAEIRTDAIDIGEQNLRIDPDDDDFIEFAADLARRGLLQPIGVHHTPGGRYQLRWGKRRLTAARHLGWKTITARIVTATERTMEDDALAENLHRKPLTLEEECRAVAHLATTHSPDQVAALLSKSRQWVLRRLTIPNLPADLQDDVLSGALPIGAAELLALLDSEAERNLLHAHYTATKPTLAVLRQSVKAWQDGARLANNTPPPTDQPQPFPVAPTIHTCTICHTPRLETETVLIRVCATGCPQPPTTTKLNNEHPTAQPTDTPND